MNRAYAILDIRAVSEDGAERIIEGIASTPAADRMDDIVEPMGAEYSVPMPFLWQHNSDEPVGQVEFAKPTKTGIPFRARLVHPGEVDSETLKERLRLAWDSVKQKLVRAVSIGFRPLETNRMESGGYRFVRWEWLELSLVTIPANAEAVITTIKQFDIGRPAGEETGASAQDDGAVASMSAEQLEMAVTGKILHVAKLNRTAPVGAPFVIRRINHLS
jgi:HK97 family phage prohead protease